MPIDEGRPELTWTTKPLRLLAHEDGSHCGTSRTAVGYAPSERQC